MVTLTLIASIAIAAIDQALKLAVDLNMEPGQIMTLIPHILDITYVKNTGAALGMMQGHFAPLSILTAIIVAAFVFVIFTKKLNHKLFFASAGLIIGGALGNLIDRVVRGYVIDYLQLSFFPPVCNLADYCLSVGCVLLLVYILFFHKPDDKGGKLDNVQKG